MAVCGAWFPRVLTSWRRRAAVAAVIGTVALASAAPAALAGTTAKAAAQRVIATVRVGDGPATLAVDPLTGAVYVVNQGSRTVTVISGRTSKVAITVPIKESSALSPCGVTVSPVTGDVYVSNCATGVSKQEPVTVLSGRTNKVAAVITVDQPASDPEDGTYPKNIAVSPVTGEVYVFSTGYHQPNSLTVIDRRTNKIITSIPGPDGLGSIQLGVGRTGTVYASGNETNTMNVFSGKTNQLINTIYFSDSPGDSGFTEFAISQRTGDAYVPDTVYRDNAKKEIYPTIVGVSMISAQTGKITSTIPLPKSVGYGALSGPSSQIAVSPETGDIYTLNPVPVNPQNANPPYEVSVISR